MASVQGATARTIFAEQHLPMKLIVKPVSARLTGYRAIVVCQFALSIAMAVSGCAANRKFVASNQGLTLSEAKQFYIGMKDTTTSVEYNYLLPIVAGPVITAAVGYDTYAGGRQEAGLKVDVPEQIVRYLKNLGKVVQIGSIKHIPDNMDNGTVIITYDELWGWDFGDIIKQLHIKAFQKGNEMKSASVAFDEMTIFNSHPTAKSLVPKMMDILFSKNREMH
jgi:hypothetical protein